MSELRSLSNGDLMRRAMKLIEELERRGYDCTQSHKELSFRYNDYLSLKGRAAAQEEMAESATPRNSRR